MKPAPFDFVQPTTIGEAVAALEAAGDEGKLLAGGQSLIPMLSMRLARPAVLVDLSRVVGLDHLESTETGVRVGAMVRQRSLVDQTHHPLLAEAAGWIGHRAIRSRGTMAGSLAHADSAAELPLVATATDATLDITGPTDSRTVGIDRFFEGTLQTTLGDHDVLTSVTLHRPRRWGFAEIARRHGDFALVAVVVAELDSGWRIVVGGVRGVPHRSTTAEQLLDAQGLDAATALDAASQAINGLDSFPDIHASAAYRRGMTGKLVHQALTDVLLRDAFGTLPEETS